MSINKHGTLNQLQKVPILSTFCCSDAVNHLYNHKLYVIISIKANPLYLTNGP